MKTYKYLMICIMATSVAMYGCSSDDEPNKEEQKRENNENAKVSHPQTVGLK